MHCILNHLPWECMVLGVVYATIWPNQCPEATRVAWSTLSHYSQAVRQDSFEWAVLCLSYSIDEISSLQWPSVRLILWTYNNLPREYLLADFLTICTNIRSPTEHKLISHNPSGKEVHTVTMVASAHDFGSHITRGTAGVIGILISQFSGYAQIGDSKVSVTIEHQVLRLDIAVYDALRMEIF